MMGKQIKYSEEFKKKTVSTYLTGNLSAAQLAKSLGVHPHTVCNWIRQYKNKPNNSQLTIAEREILFQHIEGPDRPSGINTAPQIILEIEKQLELLKQAIQSNNFSTSSESSIKPS